MSMVFSQGIAERNGIQIGAIPAAKSSRKQVEERKNPEESAAPKIVEAYPVERESL